MKVMQARRHAIFLRRLAGATTLTPKVSEQQKKNVVQSRVQGGREDPGARLMELEAAVGRGRSKSALVTISGLGVWTRKTNFRWPQVELSTQLSIFVPRAAR